MFFATVLALVLILIDFISGGKVRGAIRDLASKTWSMGAVVEHSLFQSGYFSTRSSLESQIRALQDMAALYQEKAASYDALQAQYAELSQMNHLAASTPGITAPVASSVRSSPYGTFLVGAGTADKVVIGSKVLTSTGFVIGTVTEVSEHSSLVKESFAPGAKLDVHLGGAELELTGSGGSNATVKVPRGIDVKVGDTASVPEYGGKPVGVVQHVDSDPASAYGVAYIALPVNLSSLSFVYVTP